MDKSTNVAHITPSHTSRNGRHVQSSNLPRCLLRVLCWGRRFYHGHFVRLGLRAILGLEGGKLRLHQTLLLLHSIHQHSFERLVVRLEHFLDALYLLIQRLSHFSGGRHLQGNTHIVVMEKDGNRYFLKL